jgi:hypothetical protein
MAFYPAAHFVCQNTATSFAVALADSGGSATTLSGLEATISNDSGRSIARITASSSGVTLVPTAGATGLVQVRVVLPLAAGRREILFDVLFVDGSDTRPGLGAVTVS